MKCDKTIMNLIKRIQGQLQGILNMMEEEKSCKDLTIQLKAVKSGVEKVLSLVTTNNLIQQIEKKHQVKIEDIDEAINLVINV